MIEDETEEVHESSSSQIFLHKKTFVLESFFN